MLPLQVFFYSPIPANHFHQLDHKLLINLHFWWVKEFLVGQSSSQPSSIFIFQVKIPLFKANSARISKTWRDTLPLRLRWAQRKSRCGGPWCREVGHLGARMEGRLVNAGNVNPGLINPKRLFSWEDTI